MSHKMSKNSKTLTSLVSKIIMISYRLNRALLQCSVLLPAPTSWFEKAPGTTKVPRLVTCCLPRPTDVIEPSRSPSRYHDAGEKTHALAAVRLRRYVAVTDGEEGDGDEPQGRVHSPRRHLLLLPAGGGRDTESEI